MASKAIPLARADSITIGTYDRPLAQVRLAFVDNIRVLLVVLVVLHHLAITYGGVGGWYYQEGRADTITVAVLTLFVAVNQSFSMGFYFLIAAYFVPRPLESKGSRQFLKERFLRLGVPLGFQLLVVAPLLSYCLGGTIWGFQGSLWTYLVGYVNKYQGLDSGPLWFLEALLIFTVAYTLWWKLAGSPARQVRDEGKAPGNLAIAAFALTVGLITFVLRIWLPVGWAFAPLGLTLAYFPQYISLFIIGAVAYRRGWLSAISEDFARGWLWGPVLVVLLVLAPVLFVLGGALEGDVGPFLGGLHWQALAYALLEQFMCMGMVISLLVLFRRRHNHQGRLARALSGSAYAVYIFHSPILILVSLGLRNVELHPLLKLALAALVSLPACFVVGGLVRRLPAADRIL